jgi:hypothetical protein
MYGEKLNAYRFTPDELQQTFIDFFIRRYNYEPIVNVSLIGTIWLPASRETPKKFKYPWD